MSALIVTNIGDRCGICREKFVPVELLYTHIGGEDHEGFHRGCLEGWLKVNPICPLDRQPIDPSSLFSRTERIMARFRPALINAGYAACFEFAIAIAAAQTIGGVRAQALAGIAVGSALVAGGAEAQLVTRAVTQRDAALIGAVMTAGPVMSAAAMAAAEIGEVAAAAVGISVTVGVGAVEINRILRHIKVDPIARQNIGLAMQIGSLAGLAIASRGPLAKLPVTTLVAAVAAGVLTLVRR